MSNFILKDADMMCVVGTSSCPLKLTADHGVFVEGVAMANANDHIPNANISPFGTCAIKTAAASGVPQPCMPITPLAWLNTNMDYCIQGAPALTEGSILPCMCGGVIMFV